MDRWKTQLIEYGGMAVVLLLLIGFFGLTTDRFLTLTNFQTILAQIPAAIILAVGMTFILILGEIDLSAGSALALCSAVFAALLVNHDAPMPVAMCAAIAVGTGVGLLNGFVTTRWSVPSFIVTLAMLEIARGLTYWVTDSRTLYVGARVESIRETGLLGIPLTFMVAIAVAAAGQFLLTQTLLGRHAMVIGQQEQVALYSGINTRRVKRALFALGGALAGVASIIHTARLSASDPNSGLGFELEAIAAVVIGGTSLSGGRGSVLRSLFGVIVIATLGSGLVQAGAQEHTKRIVTGLVIVGAVIADRYRTRRA